MNDFVAMNDVYAKVKRCNNVLNVFKRLKIFLLQFFDKHQPARSAFQVARLPKDVAVEIECVAVAE